MPTFRELHHRSTPLLIPNPWDMGSARILTSMGFQALATTSAGLAFQLGVPEGKVSTAQTLEHCRDMVAATALPVSADLEKGFGDSPAAVAETIEAAAETGLAGCSIEDFTGDPAHPIFPFDEAMARVEAAVTAARNLDRDFVLTARAENFLHGKRDTDDTLKRLQAFEALGADVLYAPGLPDLSTITKVCRSLKTPVNILATPGVSVSELAKVGVARISLGSSLARTAYGSLIAAAKEMQNAGTFDFAKSAAGFTEIESHLKAATPT